MQSEHGWTQLCPYCGEVLVDTHIVTVDWQGNIDGLDCYFCGWSQWHMAESWCSLYDEEQYQQSILEKIEADDPTAAEFELRAGLVADIARAQMLSPRRVEQMVSSIYHDLGYEAILTQESRDGGRDILLFRKTAGKEEFGIVEVKRHRERIGVEFVRQLRGVQLREEAPLAILVSASGFTAGAKIEAASSGPTRRGFVMELRHLSDLLAELGLTNEPLINVMAVGRGREEYHRWFASEFEADVSRKGGNPLRSSGSDKTLVLGWWR